MTGDILCRRGRFGKPNDHRLLASRLDRFPGDRSKWSASADLCRHAGVDCAGDGGGGLENSQFVPGVVCHSLGRPGWRHHQVDVRLGDSLEPFQRHLGLLDQLWPSGPGGTRQCQFVVRSKLPRCRFASGAETSKR